MFLLRETLATKKQGKDIYFEEMTAIGPKCTDNKEAAARFMSPESARGSKAYFFAWTNFEVIPDD